MYVQSPMFEEERPERLIAFMREFPLASLVVPCSTGLEANLLPIETVSATVIRGHAARSNPLWRDALPGQQATVIFQGPNTYISPHWYVNGAKSGRRAPSWNYVTVHAHGTLRFIDDAAWMKQHLTDLTQQQEGPRENPWRYEDAPPEFTQRMGEVLYGIEMTVDRLTSKWFLSQQRTPADRESVVRHLQAERTWGSAEIARLIQDNEPPAADPTAR